MNVPKGNSKGNVKNVRGMEVNLVRKKALSNVKCNAEIVSYSPKGEYKAPYRVQVSIILLGDVKAATPTRQGRHELPK